MQGHGQPITHHSFQDWKDCYTYIGYPSIMILCVGLAASITLGSSELLPLPQWTVFVSVS